MEGELKNLLRIYVLTTASLLYSYFIAAKVQKGLLRLLSIFPVIILISVLPFSLNTLHLGLPTSFLTCFTSYKLLFFAFDKGPLIISPLPKQNSLLSFILNACFPFKIKSDHENEPSKLLFPTAIVEAAIRATMVIILAYNYDNYKQYFHKHIILSLYFFYTYHVAQILLFLAAIPARLLLRVELEPQFNSPLISTSLQDFWGHRWNLRVSDLLRGTVYTPIRTSNICKRIVGDRWASLPAVLATFVVSGLIHEWLYYYMIRESPTWDVTWFFVLQGVLVDMEIVLKKKLVSTNKFRLHRVISGPLALAILTVTVVLPSNVPIRRREIFERAIKESNLSVDFMKDKATNQI